MNLHISYLVEVFFIEDKNSAPSIVSFTRCVSKQKLTLVQKDKCASMEHKFVKHNLTDNIFNEIFSRH